MMYVGGEYERFVNDIVLGLWRFMCELICLNGI